MGIAQGRARGALRLTLGHSTTEEDIAITLQRLGEIIPRLRGLTTQPALHQM
jgi:cysteine sulfinate desulfinase/cysteine desulfurase-like protein